MKEIFNTLHFVLDFMTERVYTMPVNHKEGNTGCKVHPTSHRKTPTYNITQHHDLSQ